jgi:Fur family peroxide stress response transcriptional regulator
MRINPISLSAPGAAPRGARGFAELCRERGIRVTAQRLAVYETLAADLAHPSAETVHARLRRRMPSLSLATVYRILDSLEAEKLIRRVSTTSGVARFDANLDVHQHLVCRVCGRISDVQAPALASADPARLTFAGFEVEGLDVRILGRCRRCRAESPRRPPRKTATRRGNGPTPG